MPLTTIKIKTYKALLTQNGAMQPPLATILQNTLGGIPIITRQATGQYRLTLNGIFTENKTICPPFNPGGATVLPTYASDPLDYMWTLTRETDDYVGLYTWNAAGAFVEFEEMMTAQKLYIEINVFL